MNKMKVTPASVKLRRWFVAGVAAVMAIAWTISTLVTPGNAEDFSGVVRKPVTVTEAGQFQWRIPAETIRVSNSSPTTASLIWGGSPALPASAAIGTRIHFSDGVTRVLQQASFLETAKGFGNFAVPVQKRIWVPEGWSATYNPSVKYTQKAILDEPAAFTGAGIQERGAALANYVRKAGGFLGIGSHYENVWIVQPYPVTSGGGNSFCIEPTVSGHGSAQETVLGFPENISTSKTSAPYRGVIEKLVGLYEQGRVDFATAQAAIWRLVLGKTWTFRWSWTEGKASSPAQISAAIQQAEQAVGRNKKGLNDQLRKLRIVQARESETRNGQTTFHLKLEGYDDLTLVKPDQLSRIGVTIKGGNVISVSGSADNHTISAAQAARGFDVVVRGTGDDDCSLHSSVDVEVSAENMGVDAVYVHVVGGQSQVVANGSVSFTHTFHAEKDTSHCTPRVPVTPRGHFRITKHVSGDVDVNPDKVFNFNVACSTDEETYPVEHLGLRVNQTKTTKKYPEGAICKVTEDKDSAAIDGYVLDDVFYRGGNYEHSNVVRIGDDVDSINVIATNRYAKPRPREGVFRLKKVVSGVDSEVPNTYRFRVHCDGDGTKTVLLGDGDSQQLGPYPVGTVCSVTESGGQTDVPGYNYEGVSFSGGNVAGDSHSVRITGYDSPQIELRATNNYAKPRVGSFSISKDYADNSDYTDSHHTYKFDVTCTENDVRKHETLYVSPDQPAVSRSYAVGTRCSVSEDTDYANNVANMSLSSAIFEPSSGVSIEGDSPDQVARFTIRDGQRSIRVHAQNSYRQQEGYFRVRKVVQGEQLNNVDNYFSFTAKCDNGKATTTKTVRANSDATFGPYPVGTHCSISEDPSSARIDGYTFDGVTYAGGNGQSPNRVVVKSLDEPRVVVTATNTYVRDHGTLRIRKTVSGVSDSVNKDFSFTATCRIGDRQLYPQTVTVHNGETRTFGQFPVGTVCTVSENTDDDAADISGYSFSGVSFEGGHVAPNKASTQVTIAQKDADITVNATNTYERDKGSFSIRKAFADGSAYTGGARHVFGFDVNCAGQKVDNVNITDAGSWTSQQYPVGTRCTVAEKASTSHVDGYSFKGVTLTSTAGSVSNNKATFTIAKGNQAINVVATNDYGQPRLQTNASTKDGNKLEKGNTTQLADKVTFVGLEKNKTYTVGGYFIDKATHKAVTGFYTRSFNSNDLQGKTEENGLLNGYLTLTDTKWNVTPTANGQAFVAFEYLWDGNVPTPDVPSNPTSPHKNFPHKPIVKHENPKDPHQSVSSEQKGTFRIQKKVAGTAASKISRDAQFPFAITCGDEAARTEIVTLDHPFTSAELPVGTSCQVKEEAPAHFDGATLKKVTYTLNGDAVSDDTVHFTIKAGNTPAVTVVATNTYDTPTVTTDAKPKAPAQEDKPVTVIDKVSYTNLIAGKEYTVQGQLHYQDGDVPSASDGGVVNGIQPGDECTVNGQAVEGKTCTTGSKPNSVAYTFIAPGTKGQLVSGYVDLAFKVPASAVQTKPMVVFEDVYYNNRHVAGHHDINDGHQTVPVHEKVRFPIKKQLSGKGASLAHGMYTFTAVCARPGQTGTPQTISVDVENGQSATSAKKVTAYVGDTCKISEVSPAANPAYTSSVNFSSNDISGATGGKTLTVKVTKGNKAQLAASDFAFTATNTVTPTTATFKVTKAAVHTTGNVDVTGKKYTFEYKCADDTAWTALDPVGAKQSASGPVKPVGTSCQVREKDAQVPQADLVTTWTVNGATVNPNAQGVVPFTIGQANTVTAIAATNNYTQRTGSFTLQKKLATSVTTQQLQGTTFHLKYVCTNDGKSVKSGTQDVTANAAPVSITGVPLGSTCSVEEVRLPSTPNALHQLSWSVDENQKSGNTAEFTVTSQKVPVAVVADNTYVDKKPGFSLKKVVEGNAANVKANAVYNFNYSCTDSKTSKQLTGSLSVDQSSQWSSSADPQLRNLNVGSSCTLTEQQPSDLTNASWQGVTFDRSGNTQGTQWTTDVKAHSVTFTVPQGNTPIVVKATNTFTQHNGKVDVTKIVAGDAQSEAPHSFTFGIACTYQGQPVGNIPATKTVVPGKKAEWTGIPVGSSCHISELGLKAADAKLTDVTHTLSWTVDGHDQGKATGVDVNITDKAQPVTLIATNAYTHKPASFKITKQAATITGTPVADAKDPVIPSSFTFEYNCDGKQWHELAPVTVGASVSAENIPANAQCQVREKADATDTGSSRQTVWTVDGKPAPEGSTVSFTPAANTTVALVAVNKYPRGPQIGTTLTDMANNHDVVPTGTSVALKDSVAYYNLTPGKTYQATGELMAVNAAGETTSTGITGRASFTPQSANGVVLVNFTVPVKTLNQYGKIVAFEKLYLDGKVIAKHENPGDHHQTVKVTPTIGTTLTGEDGKSKTYDRPVDPSATVKVVDTVAYTNARVGKTYRISGELQGDNGATGVQAVSEPFTVAAPASQPHAEFASGSVKVVFDVPGSVLQNNSKLVAFEQLWDVSRLNPVAPGAKTVTPKVPGTTPDAKHENPNDPDQTMRQKPSLATVATLKEHEGSDAHVKTIQLKRGQKHEETIIDRVNWYNLPQGDYVSYGYLVDGQSGQPLPQEKASAFKPFTVGSEKNGTVDVELKYSLDPSDFKNDSKMRLVVFERVYRASDVENGRLKPNAQPIAVHEDRNDPNQKIAVTIKPPLAPANKITIKKTVTNSGQTALPADTLYGFEFSCKDRPQNIARFVLKANEVKDASTLRTDIVGKQCVVKEVGPVKSDYSEANKWVPVKLPNLQWKAIQWSLNGKLQTVPAENSAPQGQPANNSYTVTVPASGQGADINLAVEAGNIFAEAPKPQVPVIHTTATNAENGKKDLANDKPATVADLVQYKNLKPATEYTIKGSLHTRKDGADAGVLVSAKAGKGCLVNGTTLANTDCKDAGQGVVSLTFTTPKAKAGAQTVDGNVELHFVVPQSELTEQKQFVAFEHLSQGNKEIASHANIDDHNQTVNVPKPPAPPAKPEIRTHAKNLDKAGKPDEVSPKKDANIADVVSYSNLKPSTQYTMKGELHSSSAPGNDAGVITGVKAGKGCLVDGKQVAGVECKDEGNGVVSLTFTTPAAGEGQSSVSGTVELHFVVPQADLAKTTNVVAFETAYHNNKEIAVHHDINDKPQTVHVPPLPPVTPPTKPPSTPPTSTTPPLPPTTPSTPPAKPEIRTHATNMDKADNEEDTVESYKDAHVADLVSYSNLKPSTQYTMKGDLHFRNNDGVDGGVITGVKAGKGCLVDGKQVAGVECKDEGNGVVSLTFTTPAAGEGQSSVSGTVELHFVVPQADLAKTTHVVAFETAYENRKIIARHHDINDHPQTVKVAPKPSLKTTASRKISMNGKDVDKTITALQPARMKDLIEYKGLRAGRKYVVEGSIHVNKDGADEGILSAATAGKGCTVEGVYTDGVDCQQAGPGVVSFVFSPSGEAGERVNGHVTMQFLIPASSVKEDESFVVFERVYAAKDVKESGSEATKTVADKTTLVAEHSDITDKGQTVTVATPPVIPPSPPTVPPTTPPSTPPATPPCTPPSTPPNPDLPHKPILPPTPTTPPTTPGGHTPPATPPGGHTPPSGWNCPSVGTVLNVDTDRGTSRILESDKNNTVTDTVEFKGLNPSTAYTMLGRLHADGNATAAGILKGVSAGATCKVVEYDSQTGAVAKSHSVACVNAGNGFVKVNFTTSDIAKSIHGVVYMQFKVPANDVAHLKKVVAFESLFLGNTNQLVAWHHDIKSKPQAVTVHHPTPPCPPNYPNQPGNNHPHHPGNGCPPPVTPPAPPHGWLAKTGATALTVIVLGLMALACGGLLIWASPATKRRRKH